MTKLREAEQRMVVARARGGEVVSCSQMGVKCLLPKRSEF